MYCVSVFSCVLCVATCALCGCMSLTQCTHEFEYVLMNDLYKALTKVCKDLTKSLAAGGKSSFPVQCVYGGMPKKDQREAISSEGSSPILLSCLFFHRLLFCLPTSSVVSFESSFFSSRLLFLRCFPSSLRLYSFNLVASLFCLSLTPSLSCLSLHLSLSLSFCLFFFSLSLSLSLSLFLSFSKLPSLHLFQSVNPESSFS